jgi:hypothetical protein
MDKVTDAELTDKGESGHKRVPSQKNSDLWRSWGVFSKTKHGSPSKAWKAVQTLFISSFEELQPSGIDGDLILAERWQSSQEFLSHFWGFQTLPAVERLKELAIEYNIKELKNVDLHFFPVGTNFKSINVSNITYELFLNQRNLLFSAMDSVKARDSSRQKALDENLWQWLLTSGSMVLAGLTILFPNIYNDDDCLTACAGIATATEFRNFCSRMFDACLSERYMRARETCRFCWQTASKSYFYKGVKQFVCEDHLSPNGRKSGQRLLGRAKKLWPSTGWDAELIRRQIEFQIEYDRVHFFDKEDDFYPKAEWDEATKLSNNNDPSIIGRDLPNFTIPRKHAVAAMTQEIKAFGLQAKRTAKLRNPVGLAIAKQRVKNGEPKGKVSTEEGVSRKTVGRHLKKASQR